MTDMKMVERILDAVFGPDRPPIPTPADVAKRPRAQLTVKPRVYVSRRKR